VDYLGKRNFHEVQSEPWLGNDLFGESCGDSQDEWLMGGEG